VTVVPRPSSTVRDFWLVLKPNVMQLVVFTGWVGLYLAPVRPHPVLGLVAVLCIAAAAGAAAAVNNWFDADIDRRMARTRVRPTASGAVDPDDALALGVTLSIISVSVMGLALNWTAAALLALTIAFYVFVYTLWLKRRTPANTFWGGICGAAPVLIGWAAVTGSLAAPAWVLFAVVFLWQPPHFYALAIKFKDDYARAGIPMLPVVASARRVNAEILIFAWLTVAASVAVWPLGMTPVYGVTAVAVGALFIVEAHRLVGRSRRGEPLRPMRLFHWSTTYLTILSVAVAIDSLL
jgi:heme o synthase